MSGGGRGRRLVLVTGMPGSGKSVLSSLAREMGLPVYVMGDVIREEAARRGIPATPDNLNKLARQLRKEHGEDIVARRILEKLERDDPGFAVVDGVRSLREVEVLGRYGETVVVAVHASPRTRFERLRRRGRPGDPSSWEEFRRRDLTELGFSLGWVIALADYMLVNEGDVYRFRERARRLLLSLAAGEKPDPDSLC